LTITRLLFSPDDRYLLSVSRDRSWHLFERQSEETYIKVAGVLKAHARIIWDCAWSEDGSIFVTASRDKQVKVWKNTNKDSKTWSSISTISLLNAAMAVAITHYNEYYVLAIGTEPGHIHIYMARLESPDTWESKTTLGSNEAHFASVTRLAWRPWRVKESDLPPLASCSDDHSIRVTRIALSIS